MAVPIDLLNNSESSADEDFSDAEISDLSEDESMEDESVEDESSESEITSPRETETNRTEEEEFWVRYPYLKSFLGTNVAKGLIPEDYDFERAKLLGDDKANELNEKGKALFLKGLELCKETCELITSAISAMKSVK